MKFSGCCVLDFPLGRGVVCDALDFVAATMCVGEEATVPTIQMWEVKQYGHFAV